MCASIYSVLHINIMFTFTLIQVGPNGMEGRDQIEAAGQFGTRTIFSTHAIHEKAVHEAVFRLSNDSKEGWPNAGNGWHHDGLHLDKTFGHIAYHLAHVPKKGQTRFQQ